mmetsp:Transcript_23832/g.37937  ORF Transcript_23832/g.37937 Transcript_23832/m.37937 type:complete len:201 (-) Transcript_23832:143-745(-)
MTSGGSTFFNSVAAFTKTMLLRGIMHVIKVKANVCGASVPNIASKAQYITSKVNDWAKARPTVENCLMTNPVNQPCATFTIKATGIHQLSQPTKKPDPQLQVQLSLPHPFPAPNSQHTSTSQDWLKGRAFQKAYFGSGSTIPTSGITMQMERALPKSKGIFCTWNGFSSCFKSFSATSDARTDDTADPITHITPKKVVGW